jgi:hypothetical protein
MLSVWWLWYAAVNVQIQNYKKKLKAVTGVTCLEIGDSRQMSAVIQGLSVLISLETFWEYLLL